MQKGNVSSVVTKSLTHSPDIVLRVEVGGGATVVIKECHVADAAGFGAPAPTHKPESTRQIAVALRSVLGRIICQENLFHAFILIF